MKKRYVAAATVAMVIGVHSLLACYQQDYFVCQPANQFLGYINYPQVTCDKIYVSGVVTYDAWYGPTINIVTGAPYVTYTHYHNELICTGECYTYDSCITGYDIWGPNFAITIIPDGYVAQTTGCQ